MIPQGVNQIPPWCIIHGPLTAILVRVYSLNWYQYWACNQDRSGAQKEKGAFGLQSTPVGLLSCILDLYTLSTIPFHTFLFKS